MDSRPSPSLAEQIAAVQGWWREAGVDLAFADEPRAWLDDLPREPQRGGFERPAALDPPPAAQAAPTIGGERCAWPRDLQAFRSWWLEEPSLDGGGSYPRIAPRGPHGAPLAIMVPMPEPDDRDTLLSGVQGRLIASMTQAMGLASEEVYLASALARHTPVPDWRGLAEAGLGAVLLHHLSLAAPRRLLVLGRDILPLLGHDPAQSAPAVSELSILDAKLPLLASYSPGRLLDHARLRASLWRRWLDWNEREAE